LLVDETRRHLVQGFPGRLETVREVLQRVVALGEGPPGHAGDERGGHEEEEDEQPQTGSQRQAARRCTRLRTQALLRGESVRPPEPDPEPDGG
jgi:hypothetical protein